jgi:hypothetical protein
MDDAAPSLRFVRRGPAVEPAEVIRQGRRVYAPLRMNFSSASGWNARAMVSPRPVACPAK